MQSVAVLPPVPPDALPPVPLALPPVPPDELPPVPSVALPPVPLDALPPVPPDELPPVVAPTVPPPLPPRELPPLPPSVPAVEPPVLLALLEPPVAFSTTMLPVSVVVELPHPSHSRATNPTIIQFMQRLDMITFSFTSPLELRASRHKRMHRERSDSQATRLTFDVVQRFWRSRQ